MSKNQKNPHFFEKTQNQRSTGYSFFQKLQRTASSLEGISGFHETTSGFVNGYLILSILRKPWLYINPGI
jgi:hypothetical protein